MLTLHLDVADLASLRFGYSPIQETVQSMWALRHPGYHRHHQPWRAAAIPLLTRFDWPLLDSLEGPRGWIPDFLTPYPHTNTPAFADEIAALRRTDPDRVRRDILAAYVDFDGRTAPRPDTLAELDHDPAGLRDAIADALQNYWELLIAPHWPRLRDVLDDDLS